MVNTDLLKNLQMCHKSVDSVIWVVCPTLSPPSIYEEKPITGLAIKLAN